VLSQILVSYFESDNDPETQRKVFAYFGTFSRSMLTMFEITLGNWVPVARLLHDGVNEWFMVFSLFHKLTMGFAVLGVINGVFIQETFKVAACDDTLMLLQKQRALKLHATKMKNLFSSADSSGDDCVDLDEFRSIFEKGRVRTWLAAQELEFTDAESLFELLVMDKPMSSQRAGEITLSALDFVTGVSRLKGSAKSMDLRVLMNHQEELREDFWQMTTCISSIEEHIAQALRRDPLTSGESIANGKAPEEVQHPEVLRDSASMPLQECLFMSGVSRRKG